VTKSWAKRYEQKSDNHHSVGHTETEYDFFDKIQNEIKME
jgi:hypothetical protein